VGRACKIRLSRHTPACPCQELALAQASGQHLLRVAVLCEKGRALQLMGQCEAQLQAQTKALQLCRANVAGPDGCASTRAVHAMPMQLVLWPDEPRRGRPPCTAVPC